MRWEQGRATIEHLLGERRLEYVPANREHAAEVIDEAQVLLTLVPGICTKTPRHAYTTLYDAARLALGAVLENQGLRATSFGGHVAVYQAVRAQVDPPLGQVIRAFDELRRERHDAGYPSADIPLPTAADVHDDLPRAAAIVDLAARLLDEMSPFR